MSIKPLLKSLYEIEIECANALEKKKDDSLDDFTKAKRKFADDMRTIKTILKERDELINQKSNEADVARKSADIRHRLTLIENDSFHLQRLQKKREKNLLKEKNNDVKEQIENDELVVQLAFQHIKDITNKEHDVDDLFSNTEDIEIMVNGIPDIDDPKFQILKKNDEEIDRALEDVLESIRRLKGISGDINSELKKEEPIIDGLNIRVDKGTSKLQTLNTRLSAIVKTVRSPRNCCCDCILLICLLGCAAAIVVIVSGIIIT